MLPGLAIADADRSRVEALPETRGPLPDNRQLRHAVPRVARTGIPYWDLPA